MKTFVFSRAPSQLPYDKLLQRSLYVGDLLRNRDFRETLIRSPVDSIQNCRRNSSCQSCDEYSIICVKQAVNVCLIEVTAKTSFIVRNLTSIPNSRGYNWDNVRPLAGYNGLASSNKECLPLKMKNERYSYKHSILKGKHHKHLSTVQKTVLGEINILQLTIENIK